MPRDRLSRRRPKFVSHYRTEIKICLFINDLSLMSCADTVESENLKKVDVGSW